MVIDDMPEENTLGQVLLRLAFDAPRVILAGISGPGEAPPTAF